MNRLLTRGLHNYHLHGGEDWRELVTAAIQGKWPAPAARPQTLEAEHGLGILGKPYYFYVLRAEDSYGWIVFVLSEAEGVAWPADARGATPFDSGGWWSGKIHTDPPLGTTERQAAFQTLDVPLCDWEDAFERYILAHYDTLGDYIEGRAPRPGNRPPKTGFTILRGQPNTARAWTWEVRIPHDMIAGRLELRAIHMSEDNRGKYIHWLGRSPLADSERQRIYRWIFDHVIVSEKTGSVVQTVEESMEAAHG